MLPCSRAIDCDSDYPHQTIIWCDDMIWWYDKIYNIYSQKCVHSVHSLYTPLFCNNYCTVIEDCMIPLKAWYLHFRLHNFTTHFVSHFKQVLLYQKFPPLPRNGRRRTTRLRCLWCFRVFGRARSSAGRALKVQKCNWSSMCTLSWIRKKIRQWHETWICLRYEGEWFWSRSSCHVEICSATSLCSK